MSDMVVLVLSGYFAVVFAETETAAPAFAVAAGVLDGVDAAVVPDEAAVEDVEAATCAPETI